MLINILSKYQLIKQLIINISWLISNLAYVIIVETWKLNTSNQIILLLYLFYIYILFTLLLIFVIISWYVLL